MVLYISQSFTASNGTAPANLVVGFNPTGGGCTVQSNKAEFKTGTVGGYNGTGRIDRRVSVDGTNALSVADVQVTVAYTAVSGEQYPQLVARCPDATTYNGGTGYTSDLGGGTTLRITKVISGVETILASTTVTTTAGVQYLWRFRVVGSFLQAWWGTTLAAAPTLSTTDSALTAAGFADLLVKTGNAAASSFATFDDLEVTDGDLSPMIALPPRRP